MNPVEKEHLYISGEGGYQKIVEKEGRYYLISNESALADLLMEEERKAEELHKEVEYSSLEEVMDSFLPNKRKAIKEGRFFRTRISDELQKLL